ncbi:unnamed protein product [Urochloa decumbens]|uniref:Knottins-like domain-containing protein n=1 Tax=Urochloa decumbens TaxID=240449 RepID=A0ABC9AKU5_9POAL
MAASWKNLSPAIATLLLLVVMAAEPWSVDAARISSPLSGGFHVCNPHLSGNFHGWCLSYSQCVTTCKGENSENIGGYCDDLPPRCYCYPVCPH